MQPGNSRLSRLLARMLLRRPLNGAAELERQYRRGRWDFLYNIEEIAHHMIILGYLPYFHQNPAILDVGCGEGRWFELLQASGSFQRYVGIDVSPTAVARARRKAADARSAFIEAPFEDWQTDERFDIIIFSESLYYAERPRAVLQRYAGLLGRKGTLIVSIHEHFGHEEIWRRIAGDYHVIAGDTVRNERGQTWTVRALRPRSGLTRL